MNSTKQDAPKVGGASEKKDKKDLKGGRETELGTPPSGKFGAFTGVFTPSILTILGVIMFLRFPWVVGHAGLAGALLIVALVKHLTIKKWGEKITS